MRSPMGDNHLHIRMPSGDDIPELVTLEDTCFVGYYREHRFSKSHFKTYLRNERAIFLVAMESNTLIGYIAGIVRTARKPFSARIESIAVLPSARATGVGRLLLQCFTEAARQRGSHTVTLEVAVANQEAQRFFCRQGFRPLQQLAAYYSPRHDGMRMKLVL